MTPVSQLGVSAHSPLPPSVLHDTPSPLVICDRLLTLAQDADRAGCSMTAEHLIHLAHVVLDEK